MAAKSFPKHFEHRLSPRGCTHDACFPSYLSQVPTSDVGNAKARKRQREGDEAAAAVAAATQRKKGKGGNGAARAQEEDKDKGEEENEEEVELEGEGEGEGDRQLVKTGFFSAVKFSALPLSAGMLAALANLNFSTTTKIQASCCNVMQCNAGNARRGAPWPSRLI